ncbi:MAG: FlgD immunoglobulin-like domain containing protein [bacterium]
MRQQITKYRHRPYPEERNPLEILVPSAFVSFTLLFFFLWFQPDKVQNLQIGRWLAVTGGLVLTTFAIMSFSQYVLLRTIPRNPRLMTGKSSQGIALTAIPLLVQTLVREVQTAGEHVVSWDGRDAHGQAVASGIYLYRLVAGKQVQTRRMVVLR